MLPEIGRGFMRFCKHAFLIRHPARVLASYAAKRENVTLDDLGFVQQERIFREAQQIAGRNPPVVDADMLLADPPGVLGSLCKALGIPFSKAMLSWPPGLRPSDGVWASHWYDSVARSTGFSPPRPVQALTEPHLIELEKRAMPIYDRLVAHALR
jgi:hypothetical protein